MGTRGLRVFRFRKRYYVFYNHYDSYPEGLGKQIVADIPADPAKFQAWLTSQRAMVAEWEAIYLRFITIMPGNEINTAWDDEEDEPKERQKERPAWMKDAFPSLFVPLNDTYVEYIYILVSHSLRFLFKIPVSAG